LTRSWQACVTSSRSTSWQTCLCKLRRSVIQNGSEGSSLIGWKTMLECQMLRSCCEGMWIWCLQ
jgi:hypothetical protein